jgi:hypothetical protein
MRFAYCALRAVGVRGLTAEQRTDWARFVVTFPVRTPETMRTMGPAEFRNAMEIARGNASGPPDLEDIVTGLLAKQMPANERNVPLKIAMELATDPEKLRAVSGMEWWLRRFDRHSVLLSDRPLLANIRMKYPCGIPLNNPNCLIVLPVAPDTVFFASANRHTRTKTRG